MKINDPQVTILLDSMKDQKGPNRSHIRTKSGPYIFKLPKLSFKNCEHKRPYANCIVCQANDNDVSTDFKTTKLLYPRFAIPYRPGPGSDSELNTDEILKKHRLEILKNWPKILREKKSTYYDCFIYFADQVTEELTDNHYFRCYLWLAALFYDVKKLTGFNVPILTDYEKSKIEYSRRHIFDYQLSRINDRLYYKRNFD